MIPYIKAQQWWRAPVQLTTPTDVKAATMLMSVGIMLNLPAYKGKIIIYISRFQSPGYHLH